MRSNDGEVVQSMALSGRCVGSPLGSNDDDRGLRPKQGGVVGAAASKTRVPPRHEADAGCRNPELARQRLRGLQSSSCFLQNFLLAQYIPPQIRTASTR